MDSSDSSYSQFSGMDEKFIKKNINPVKRGPSAIFGDPISEEKKSEIMNLPSPTPSEAERMEKSRVEINSAQWVGGEQLERRPPSKGEDEEGQNLLNMLNRPQENIDLIRDSSEVIKEQYQQELNAQKEERFAVEERKQEQGIIEEVIVAEVAIKEKEKPEIVPENLALSEEAGINGPFSANQKNNAELAIQERESPSPEKKEPGVKEEQQQNRNEQISIQHSENSLLRLKAHNIFKISSEQMKPIMQSLEKNTQHIQMFEHRLQDQNNILSQFKEDTSRKLEENIKLTLKQKMNEINRENTKQLKDIKNVSEVIKEQLQKNDKRLDNIDKNIEEILKLLKNKK